MRRGQPRLVWGVPDVSFVAHPLLDRTELAYCARLTTEADRARHATGRVLAKLEGANRLGVDPRRLSVVPDVGATVGRPQLFLDHRPSPVHLSIAHAGRVVVVALGNVPCGVDVEEIAALAPALDTSVAFSARERARLAETVPEERLALAARWWTGKEAALKAVGVGLAVEAATIDADCGTTRVRALGSVTTLRLIRPRAPLGYLACLAVVTRRRPARPDRRP